MIWSSRVHERGYFQASGFSSSMFASGRLRTIHGFRGCRLELAPVDSKLEHCQDLQARQIFADPLGPKQLFPDKTSYTWYHGNFSTEEFQYGKAIDEKNLVLLGTEVRSKEEIYIMLFRHYSRDAHECIVSLGLAPVLRGYDRIPGEWVMVVFDALCGFQSRRPPEAPLSVGIRRDYYQDIYQL
ncbi:hypothetical protein JVU11DRAFT_8223 [Chiua virens]|nr:hypothetical protein JVU11DRAFT_8223 [Chiua virens]